MENSLKTRLLPVGAHKSRSQHAKERSRIAKIYSSGDDDDPDELCLKWNPQSGVFTKSGSSKPTSLRSYSLPKRSPELQKALSVPQELETKSDRYPHSIDTSFWTVIDDHRGEPCRPPKPMFYKIPPNSLSLRCNVLFPYTGIMSWAHIRPGTPIVDARKKADGEELWINFHDVKDLLLIIKQVSIQGAFSNVTGPKGRQEILLKITRKNFRYWSENQADCNEILICCFSEALKLVIIGGRQKAEVAALKAWLTKEFYINGSIPREKITTGKFQLTEAEMVPSLGQLYKVVGCTPVKFYLKRSIELEHYKDLLFNFRQMIAKAAHVFLSKKTVQSAELLQSAIEVFQSMLGKYIPEPSLGWFDYTIKVALTNKEERKQSTLFHGQTSDIIFLFNSIEGKWLNVSSFEFSYEYSKNVFLFKFNGNQGYPIQFINFRYFKATNFGGRYSLRVQLKWTSSFLHFEFSCKFIWMRLVNQLKHWLGNTFCCVSLDDSILPSEPILGKVIDGKWPVFGTTKEWLDDSATFKMIRDDCSRMAKQLVDAVAICLVLNNIDDDRLIENYKALKAHFIAPKVVTIDPLKLTAQDLQWRYGRFDFPN